MVCAFAWHLASLNNCCSLLVINFQPLRTIAAHSSKPILAQTFHVSTNKHSAWWPISLCDCFLRGLLHSFMRRLDIHLHHAHTCLVQNLPVSLLRALKLPCLGLQNGIPLCDLHAQPLKFPLCLSEGEWNEWMYRRSEPIPMNRFQWTDSNKPDPMNVFQWSISMSGQTGAVNRFQAEIGQAVASKQRRGEKGEIYAAAKQDLLGMKNENISRQESERKPNSVQTYAAVILNLDPLNPQDRRRKALVPVFCRRDLSL